MPLFLLWSQGKDRQTMFEGDVRWQHTDVQVSVWTWATGGCCYSLVRYITTMMHKKIKKNKTKKIALYSMIITVLCEDKEVTRREWCKNWLHKRSERGSHVTISHGLQIGYESDFTNYMRT